MRKPVIWVERGEDRVKTEFRVTFPGGQSMRWQSKRADADAWVYDFTPSVGQWEFLADKVEDRYRRRAATWEDVLRIRQWRDEARRRDPEAGKDSGAEDPGLPGG
ncbi:MAG: hypothetical protein FJ221_17115 [Lentisphaerae bacterium]|nr:hypothetical protein [Lentisphaerota bacterium]